jgi:hypothetical protein
MTSPARRSVDPFKLALAAWIDLRGYGAAVASANFNPMHPASGASIARLRTFHEVIARHSGPNFRSLTINDGAVFYRDLPWRSSSPTYDFLKHSWAAFQQIQEADKSAGGPGARMVLGAGFRVLGSRRGIDASASHARSILRQLESQEITAEQAIRALSSSARHSDVIPQLQANFAFTKSYLAENSGKLPGSSFYVDLVLFDAPLPVTITLGQAISWTDTNLGLSADFAEVRELLEPGQGERHTGIRNGLAIARALAPSNDVLAALKTLER